MIEMYCIMCKMINEGITWVYILENINEAIRGGPLRVAVLYVLQTHWLDSIIWLINSLVF